MLFWTSKLNKENRIYTGASGKLNVEFFKGANVMK